MVVMVVTDAVLMVSMGRVIESRTGGQGQRRRDDRGRCIGHDQQKLNDAVQPPSPHAVSLPSLTQVEQGSPSTRRRFQDY